MKYADQVISLLAAHPDRSFRMTEIVRFICPSPKDQRERTSIRVSVWRALGSLREAKAIEKLKPRKNGSYSIYKWKTEKPLHAIQHNHFKNRYSVRGELPPEHS